MSGTWVLLLLITTMALPVIVVFFWFRVLKSPITLPWFLASLAAGIISVLAAVLVQRLFPPPGTGGFLPLLFGVFIRIALVEEASRFVSLVPLLSVIKRSNNFDKPFFVALGLVSGLGFAMIESAFYGIAESDFRIMVLRAVTAAPLHGACGIRVCAALLSVRSHPVKALAIFASAVLIHGAYNLMIVNPALPSWLAIPIAFAALFASIHYFTKTSDRDEEKPFSSYK